MHGRVITWRRLSLETHFGDDERQFNGSYEVTG
jgi:hypothetical protein